MKFFTLWVLLGLQLTLPFVAPEVCQSSPCVYHFNVQWSRTMMYKNPANSRNYHVKDVNHTLVGSAEVFGRQDPDVLGQTIDPEVVITGDGTPRDVITINGQFPGPTIEVLEGLEVVVHVTNNMMTDSLTIHWHGLHQIGTPWMDGSAYVTQCPVIPKETFTYRFIACPNGTHWYHSHLANQRQDGLYGTIIVHPKLPEVPHFVMMISDFYKFTGSFMNNGIQDDHSVVVNGRGRKHLQESTLPLATFTVEPSKKYRFRTTHSGVNFGYEVSIDNYTLKIVASDGYDIEEIEVDRFFIYPGERVDFEIVAQGEDESFWVRAKEFMLEEHVPSENLASPTNKTVTLPVPEPYKYMKSSTMVEGRAILTNKFDEPTLNPSSHQRECTSEIPCTFFNCPGQLHFLYNSINCLNFDSIVSKTLDDTLETMELKNEASQVEVFNFITSGSKGAKGSSVNGRKFISAKQPLFNDPIDESTIYPCNDCIGCSCTNIISFQHDNIIDIVVSNIQGDYASYAHHPIHMHGHSFAVLYMGYPTYNATSGLYKDPSGIKCQDKYCDTVTIDNLSALKGQFNTVNPPLKDTILVPPKGFAVLRIRADNPGYWLMHCHVTKHFLKGMGVLINSGPGHHMPVPNDFSRCNAIDNSKIESVDNSMGLLKVEPWSVALFAFAMVGVGAVLTTIVRYVRRKKKHTSAPI